MIDYLLIDSDGIAASWRSYVSEYHLEDMTIQDMNKLSDGERSLLMTQIYKDDPHLFYMLEPLQQFNELLEGIKSLGIKWRILTASAIEHPDFETVKGDKQQWFLENFNVEPENVIVVATSADKKLFANAHTMLVDDFKRNCDEFESAGGHAVLVPTDTYKPVDVLNEINNKIKNV